MSASAKQETNDFIDQESIPYSFRCPITGELMKDPVFNIDDDYNTYERSAIEEWFYVYKQNKSPLTRKIILDKTLHPNRNLKSAIDEFIEKTRTKTLVATVDPTKLKVAPSTIIDIDSEPLEALALEPVLGSINASIFRFNGKSEVNFNVMIPTPASDTYIENPLTLIFVVDISGSMKDIVSSGKHSDEADIFTKLNLVQHSLNTICESLPQGSKIAIITFNNSANIILPPIDIVHKEIIKSKIITLYPDGGTNIWAGLYASLELVKQLPTQNNHILLFTDGEANYNPPRGLVATFNQFYDRENCRVHTFAYGNTVDSADLAEVATNACGIFGYIPDGTMVGTIFINALSNILSLASSNVKIIAKFANSSTNSNYGIRCVLYDQPRNFTYEYDPSNPLEYLELHYNGNIIRQTTFQNDIDHLSAIHLLARRDIIRLITLILSNPKDLNPATKELKSFISKYRPYSEASPFINDLLVDCEHPDANKGQIEKSIKNFHWFNEWGCHYLRSLIRAYQLEMCLNFKDLAPQHFSGSVFKKHQLEIERIFNTLTPITSDSPVSTIPTTYYDPRGGCFTGGWNVLLADGKCKPVCKVSKGDVVISNDSPTGHATIICVVKLMIVKKMCMISPDGINGITAFHPLWIASTPVCSSIIHRNWVFPESITDDFITVNNGEYMYDFITDKGFSVCLVSINSPQQFNVACLGHQCKDNSVIEHEYFGTQSIINDLKMHPGWDNGSITLNKWEFLRKPSGLVYKLIF